MTASAHGFLFDLGVHHMPLLQLFRNVFEGDAHVDHEDGEMVDEVGDLEDGLFTAAAFAGDDDFGGFFAHFFQDLVDAFVEKIGGVGTLFGRKQLSSPV